jgi:thiol-disulfide isomerase/thioredoxin
MKKTLLLGLLLAAGFTASAQLADGTVAPDFTAQDIDGNWHTLYDYLEAGKTVVIDVSATWCGPCWNYHNTHALENLYEAYGLEASDEVMVFFIEGDHATTNDNLHGISGPAISQGDWTAGTPYPIIDDTAALDIAGDYNIAYFPTVYRICPDKTLTLVDQQTISQLKSGISNNCQELEGVQNFGTITAKDVRLCEATGNVKTTIKNFGANTISTALLTLKDGDTTVATKVYDGSIAQFGSEEIEFDTLEFDGVAEYTVEITNINSGTPFGSEELLAADFTVTPSASTESLNNITITVHTDDYPGEIGFKILNSAGQSVFSQNYSAAASNKNKTKVHYVTLEEGIDCYSVELTDDYGDGWVYGNAEHGMTIVSGWGEDGDLLFETDGAIGSGLTQDAVLKTTGVLANNHFESEGFAIYPNPSTGIFNFATQQSVDVTIVDITGKIVHTANGVTDGGTINLSALQSGMYIAKIKAENGAERIEKLMIK